MGTLVVPKNAHSCALTPAWYPASPKPALEAELGRAFFMQRRKEVRDGKETLREKAICPLGFIPAAEPEQLVAPENF